MPVNFDIKELKQAHNCNIWFETGLWDVESSETSLCKAVSTDSFDKYCSVEINKDFIEIATRKFKDNNKVILFEGDSKNLAEYLNKLELQDHDKILFFLDSHGSGLGCPLVQELQAIKNLKNNNHVILIDDLRIIRTCKWGEESLKDCVDFEKILKEKILDINQNYKFSYLNGHIDNDVLLCSI